VDFDRWRVIHKAMILAGGSLDGAAVFLCGPPAFLFTVP
jgi:hypothetical protein